MFSQLLNSTLFWNTYVDEFILACYIPFGVAICGFFKSREHFFKDLAYQKFIFSTLLKLTIGVVFFCGLHLCYQLFCLASTQAPFFNELFYNTTDHLFVTGNFFFKKDQLAVIFQLIVTFLVFIYLLVVQNFFKVTTQTFKYCLELPILIVTIFFGLKIFLISYDLIIIILTLELVSFCTVILIGLQNTLTSQNIFPLEAAIKYFIFNAVAVAFMLVALSGYYGFLGNLNLNTLVNYFLFFPVDFFLNWETFLGLHLIFFSAYLMKLGAAPFHQWVPDVYEGSELLMTAFLVLIIGPALNLKFFIFLKLFLPVFEVNNFIFTFFLICGFISILFGTFNAFLQVRLKRFLAYSAITHLGYILLGIGTGTYFGLFASFFYLILYIVMNLIFFGLLLFFKNLSQLSLIYLSHLKTLFNSHFLLFFLLAIPLLSYAGFPPFGGFFSKFFILLALVETNYIFLSFFLIGYIVVNAYLYLRFFKIAIFEKTMLQVFLPLKTIYTPANISIRQPISFRFWHSLQQHYFIYFFFLLNASLLLFVFFLPFFSLLLQHQLFALFLFY